MNQPTIAYFANRFPFGDSEAFIWPEVQAHRSAGCKIVFCPLQRGAPFHTWEGLTDNDIVEPRLITPSMIRSAAFTLASRPDWAARFAKFTMTGAPRVRIRNLAVLCKAIWLGRVLHDLGVDHIHAHWLSAPATAAMIASHVSGIPYSITAHRIDISQRNLIPEKLRSAHFIRAIDAKGQIEIQQQAPGLADKVRLIYLGTDVPETTAPTRGGSLPKICVVTAARLVGKKGHRDLIDAIALVTKSGLNVAADIFGDGPLREELEARAAAAGVSQNVRFLGNLPHRDLLAMLRAGRFDVATLPSATTENGDREGIPAFLMEAMAAGVPVISTANGGILELIQPGCGVVVPERDPEALAAALLQIAADERLRNDIARRGRRRTSSVFNVAVSAATLRGFMCEKSAREFDATMPN